MKSINKVELQGRVGSVRDGMGWVPFTLCTEEVFMDKSGDAIIETTWHVCRVAEKAYSVPLQKGDVVNVIGHIRNYKYLDYEQNERTSVEIVVLKYKKINQ